MGTTALESHWQDFFADARLCADTWVAFYFLNWFLMPVTETYTWTHTRKCSHTWRHTLSLIAVCCPSLRLALWKGHLTKPLTGRCNTCVCSEQSDTKRHLWALPWQEKHCDIWLSDWLTGLQAGWQMKAGRHTNTIEAVMEMRDGTGIMSESKGGFTRSTRPSDSYAGDCVSIISLIVLTL